jgi:hypothetical protein
MRHSEREALRARFQFRCGYCGVREKDVGAELTNDHFQPRSRGGSDEPDNWVYSCHCCNEFKGDYWQPDSVHRILHPLHDEVATHIVEEPDGMLRALSETGAFHIKRLHLNREQLVAYRRERQSLKAARSHHRELIRRLAQLEEQVQELTGRLTDLQRGE